jgi:hydroxyethylthiazole kinase
MPSSYPSRAAEDLAAVREKRPLVHNITNFVVMNYTANALLALGASPVMAHAEEEVEEMAALAGALVLNIGTLSEAWIRAMIRAGNAANKRNTPVVLDPVGAGATRLRTASARRILSESRVSVVRGNASEILSLGSGNAAATKGVDAVHSVDEAAEAARQLAGELNTVLAITGAVDLVTDGDRVLRVENGHPLLTRVTGTGCTATAVIGSFLAVDEDPLVATAGALAFFGVAAERAAEHVQTPGRYKSALIDALYALDPETLRSEARIHERNV